MDGLWEARYVDDDVACCGHLRAGYYVRLKPYHMSLSSVSAKTLCDDIGYGNAAGFLFMKGLKAPTQEATITELPDDIPSSESITEEPTERNPITALNMDRNTSSSKLLDTNMSDSEKEIEAERLMGLFQRMDRNPAMKMENPMESAVKSGKADEWEKVIEKERLEQEEKEEQEGLAEMAQYRKRKEGNAYRG